MRLALHALSGFALPSALKCADCFVARLGKFLTTNLQKIEKLYLDNANIINALGAENADGGTIRETMFLTWMKEGHSVYSSKISDFEIGGITFEVGGKNRKGRQLMEAEDGYIVKDGIEYSA